MHDSELTRNEVVASSILASSSKSKSLVNAVISSMYKAFLFK